MFFISSDSLMRGTVVLCLFLFSEPPFEFRALEVALEAICSFLDARTTELETTAYPAFEALTSKVKIFFNNMILMMIVAMDYQ